MKRLLFAAAIISIFLFLVLSQSVLARSSEWGTAGWVQFPSNDFSSLYDPGIDLTSNARLALTAKGPDVSMTYTPATYELQKLPKEESMYLQIHDAPLSAVSAHDVGTGGVMELLFFSPDNAPSWSVKCGDTMLASPSSPVLTINTGVCGLRPNRWSQSLQIIPGTGSDRLHFKTIWQGSTEKHGYGDQPTNYVNFINVFRLQTWNGVVKLAPTDPTRISYPDGKTLHFPTHQIKSDYEATINWVVTYKTIQEAFYSFEIDISNISDDYLYIWDKDADANRLFLSKGKHASQPADDGINMMVRWSDGTPLKYLEGKLEGGMPITTNPEWTHFDQTNRESFRPSWDDGSETNRFDGPSWDSGFDPEGADAIRWYKIPISERKSGKVLVGWSGSSVPQNTFAFAASGPVAPAPCSNPEVCKEEFEQIDVVPSLEIVNEVEEHCIVSKSLKTCLSSTPVPNPNLESFGLNPSDPEKSTILYHLIFENIGEEDIENILTHFEPPRNTSLLDSLIPYVIPVDESEVYTGKGLVQIDGPSSLTPGQIFSQDIGISVDEDTGMDDYDISSEGSITVGADDIPEVAPPGLVHHVGEGGVNIEVIRCYAFNFIGGEFQCRQTCDAVEPGTVVTVRDLLTNHGGELVSDYTYFPHGLSPDFMYVADSIRFDDPQFGVPFDRDGEQFPPEGGITVPGQMSSKGSRMVFFQYLVPDEILAESTEEGGTCFSHEKDSEDEFTAIEQQPECEISDNADDASSRGSICVSADLEPELKLELAAVPGANTVVYQGSSLTYFLTITNLSRQPISQLSIDDFLPEQTSCVSGGCSGIILDNPPELSQQFGRLDILVTVRINDDAQGTAISLPGISVHFRGPNETDLEITSNSIEHELIAAPEPTGDFQHEIQLSRRTVLNAAERGQPRSDQADQSIIQHTFRYEGTKRDPVWPEFSGDRYYHHNVCNFIFRSYESYDADFNSYSYVYNSAQRSQLSSFDQIKSNDVDFKITTDAPAERPELLVVNAGDSHRHQFQYTMDGGRKDSAGLNHFMQNGGVIRASQLEETLLRSVKDGIAGQVNTENVVLSNAGQGQIREDLWQYSQVSSRRDRKRCMFCTPKKCFRYDAIVPIYKWKIVSTRLIPLQASDKDYISSLTSVAWLQTKNGHIGFGTPFWTSTPSVSDPNFVDLGNQAVPTLMKFYTPPGQSNADLLISSPNGSDPLRSGLGSTGKVITGGLEQGFISSPLEEGQRQLSRGEAYDRALNPRQYFDDLINREIYGRVIHLKQSDQLPAGMHIAGSELQLNGVVRFERDTIYYWEGPATIGTLGGADVIIDGGKARLVIEGSVQIVSNVRYSKTDDADLSQIPSLRLHSTEDMTIHPSVTDVELMMLAEAEFHSGRSDQQLRILGDVIALKTFWERSPLNRERANEEMVNKPSELIYEDFRKYLLTPPGDKKLPDAGHVWREVNIATGRPLLEEVYEVTHP